jgi:hypothetical protein
MTAAEARRILEVPPKAGQREIDTAMAALRLRYVRRLQYATTPHDRDVASAVLAMAQEAYGTLTGKSAAAPLRPRTAAAPAATGAVPRRSLLNPGRRSTAPAAGTTPGGSARTRSSATASGRVHRTPPLGSAAQPAPSGGREKIVAVLICGAMVALALLVLAAART